MSKILKEIIYESKYLALKLYSLKSLSPTKFNSRELKRLYFIPDNIVTFYPNINIQKAHQIASNYLIAYYSSFGKQFDLD